MTLCNVMTSHNIMTSHTWRRVFTDTNNLWLSIYNFLINSWAELGWDSLGQSLSLNFCGMDQRTYDQFNWTRWMNSTSSLQTGPDQAAQGTMVHLHWNQCPPTRLIMMLLCKYQTIIPLFNHCCSLYFILVKWYFIFGRTCSLDFFCKFFIQ